MYGVVWYCVSEDPTYSFNDCLHMMSLFGSKELDRKNLKVPPTVWKIYAEVMYVVGGETQGTGGGPAFEFLQEAIVMISVYIAAEGESLNKIATYSKEHENDKDLTYK